MGGNILGIKPVTARRLDILAISPIPPELAPIFLAVTGFSVIFQKGQTRHTQGVLGVTWARPKRP